MIVFLKIAFFMFIISCFLDCCSYSFSPHFYGLFVLVQWLLLSLLLLLLLLLKKLIIYNVNEPDNRSVEDERKSEKKSDSRLRSDDPLRRKGKKDHMKRMMSRCFQEKEPIKERQRNITIPKDFFIKQFNDTNMLTYFIQS